MKYESLHPATGWTAVFFDGETILTTPVVFFAVCDELEYKLGTTNVPAVWPLVPDHHGYRAGALVPAPIMEGFVGLASPGEDIDPKAWKRAAKEKP